jgi:acyl transferase domain-containing protein/thioesterase domain-containing protein
MSTAHPPERRPPVVASEGEPDGARREPASVCREPASVCREPANARRARGERPEELARHLAGASPEEREAAILELVCAQTATVAGYPSPDAFDPHATFRELGFNSQGVVELYNRLVAATGLEVPLTVAFNYPTPIAVAGYLQAALEGERSEARPLTIAASSEDPIAIVGLGCRLPGGVGSARELWELVLSETDAIASFPSDRGWDLEEMFDPDPDHPGTCYATEGGFLREATEFDPAFFGIGPREALAIDPQQRLLLETAWETIEDARIDPVSLRGSHTAVFAGLASQDYSSLLSSAPAELEGLLVTGTVGSVVSGRIAHTLGLEGPALTVDTACSSSLVTLHLAAQALRAGECSLALAGGITVMATPSVFVEFSRLRGIARDGRCKSFAAAADGTIFAEGAGLLLLERLSDARRLGHRVRALIRGSAINQDGASNGLAAPNGRAQEQVISQAIANAGIAAHEVDAVEAHGTGTTLGDPIEAHALLATYGQGRPAERPLRLGSIKSNIGHAQAAAGAIGVIKMVMALHHGVLPKTLHAAEPTPNVDWSVGMVSLLSEAVAWPRSERPRRAGVSAFGISGTNAHLILEEAPAAFQASATSAQPRTARSEPRVVRPGLPGTVRAGPPRSEPPGTSRLEPQWSRISAQESHTSGPEVIPWVISAKSREALLAQAERLRVHVAAQPHCSPLDVGYSLASTRSRFRHRAALVAGDREQFLDRLAALARGEPAPDTFKGLSATGRRIAFMFTGQGSQRPGMGRDLYERFPVFTEALDEACACLESHLGRPLREVMFASPQALAGELLDQTMFTQAALFALEVALFRLFASWGLRPDYLLGHSIGELSAAHVAGVLSLADASALVAARGRLMQALPDGGAMIAVQASEEEVLETLAGLESELALAAVNGPKAVVVSGERDAAARWAASWEARGRKVKWLKVSHAFHSPLMDPMLDEFAEIARGLSFSAPEIPIVSNLSGSALTAAQGCAPEYWVSHVRQTVRFLDSMRWLDEQGIASFLELGPDGVLSAMGRSCLSAGADRAGAAREHGEPLLMPTLRAKRPEAHTVTRALAELHVHGHAVDWEAVFGGRGARTVELPTYAFQRRRFWPALPAAAPAGHAQPAASAEHAPSIEHTLFAEHAPSTGHVSPAEPTRLAASCEPAEASMRHSSNGHDGPTSTVLEVVCSHTAAVLGHDSAGQVDAQQSFLELGLESHGAVELSRRLAAATGLPLRETLLQDHPTPAALAGHLTGRLEQVHAHSAGAQSPARQLALPASASTPSGTLTGALRYALAHGRASTMIGLLETISSLRATFDSPATAGGAFNTTLVAKGHRPPRLICLPSFVGPSGPYQFAQLAAGLPAARTVCAVSLPGFRAGERLPASREVVVDTLAEWVRTDAAEAPFALLGYSSGGALAHAVAEALERQGIIPAGVMLIDAYEPDRDEQVDVLAGVLAKLLAREHEFAAVEDDGLVAMGAYVRLFADWAPNPIKARSVLLRACDSLGSTLGYARPLAPWQLADEVVEVPGDHFSIVETHARSTAAAIETWLSNVIEGSEAIVPR